MARRRFRGRALITGASTGIGRALAVLFARDGCDLVLVARTRDALQRLADDLQQAHGVQALVIPQDLSVAGSAQAVADTVRAAELPVDTLVNNAGVGLFAPFAGADPDAIRRLIQLNVTSVVELTRLFLPEMLDRRGGRILNVASTAAFLPGPGMATYYASKAFVLSFSEALREELRNTGVTVTVLAPGPTETEFQRRAGMEGSKLFERTAADAETVARAGYRGLLNGKPLVIPGLANKMVPQIVRALPRRVVTAVSRKAAELRKPVRPPRAQR